MNYPAEPGYVRHSDTSKAAAERLTSRPTIERIVLDSLRNEGAAGSTVDEMRPLVQALMERPIERSTLAARFSELEASGAIIDSGTRRMGAAGRLVKVYVLPAFHLPIRAKESTPLDRAYEALARTGHGWAVPLLDPAKRCRKGPGFCKTCKHEQDYIAGLRGKNYA